MKPLISLIGLILILGLALSLISMQIAAWIYDFSMFDMSGIFNDLSVKSNLNAARIMQIGNSIGLFLLPAFIFHKIYPQYHTLELNRSPEFKTIIFLPLVYLVSAPFLNWTIEWNQGMSLPDSLSEIEIWMRNSEESAEYLTESFLNIDGIGEFIYMTFLIAVLPALGEEFMFRGVLQQLINKRFYNPHLGVWVSAIVFSAIHMQFFGFFPRMLLGVYFGYLLVWTKNLWYPIIAHFINNFSALTLHYFFSKSGKMDELDQIGTTDHLWWLSLISFALTVGTLSVLRKGQKKSPTML